MPARPAEAGQGKQEDGGWNQVSWVIFSSPARSCNCPHRAPAYLDVGSEESNRPLGRRRPAGAADAAAGAGNPLLHRVQEEQQQCRRLPPVAACWPPCCCWCRRLLLPLLLLLLVQHSHRRLHCLLQRSQRLGRPAVVCAQAGGHTLLGSLLHRPPGALRQVAGCTPACQARGQMLLERGTGCTQVETGRTHILLRQTRDSSGAAHQGSAPGLLLPGTACMLASRRGSH